MGAREQFSLQRAGWRSTSVVLVNLGIDRPGIGGETHIRYVYDEDIPFSRISFPHRLSPRVVPDGASSHAGRVVLLGEVQAVGCISRRRSSSPPWHHLRAMGVLPAQRTDPGLRGGVYPVSPTSSTTTNAPPPWRPSRPSSTRRASTAAAVTESGTTCGPTNRSSAANAPPKQRSEAELIRNPVALRLSRVTKPVRHPAIDMPEKSNPWRRRRPPWTYAPARSSARGVNTNCNGKYAKVRGELSWST